AEQRLVNARSLAAAGDLGAARAELLAVIEAWPMHEQARHEIDAIDLGLREREQRLQGGRTGAEAGRLGGAWGASLGRAGGGRAGESARLLAKEWRARMDLVDRGLGQVLASLHGRESAGSEGIRHSLLRLEELAKVQCDHEQIPALRAALQAELAAIEQC